MPDIFNSKESEGKVLQAQEKITPKKIESFKHFHEPHTVFPLSAFADHPSGLHFATQGESEEIELFLRKHFITNLPWIIYSIFLLLLPPIVLPLVAPYLLLPVSAQLGLILVLFWYLAVFGMIILTSFINWYFNVYIVTTERVIDVDFINLLYREISATRLNLVQDVTVKAGGVIRSIFHYGDVFIQTAGTEVNFDFLAVPRPEFIANRIEELMEKARKKEGESQLEEDLGK